MFCVRACSLTAFPDTLCARQLRVSDVMPIRHASLVQLVTKHLLLIVHNKLTYCVLFWSTSARACLLVYCIRGREQSSNLVAISRYVGVLLINLKLKHIVVLRNGIQARCLRTHITWIARYYYSLRWLFAFASPSISVQCSRMSFS